MSIGHVQKTLGRRARQRGLVQGGARSWIRALREAYWSLADLKNYTFSDAEIAAMQRLLRATSAAPQ